MVCMLTHDSEGERKSECLIDDSQSKNTIQSRFIWEEIFINKRPEYLI